MEGFGGHSISIMRTQLPVTRVKKICKIDPDCTTISAEAVQLLTLATERFIGLFAKTAYGQALLDKRKTLQLKDLEFCIKNYELFNFLDGALDGWPERSGTKRGDRDRLSDATVAKMSSKAQENFTTVVTEEEEEEPEDLSRDIDGLSDEIYGFDESLQGTIPTESPFDRVMGTTAEQGGKAGKENGQDAEMEEDVTETQALNPEVFGHYGYSFSTNSAQNGVNEDEVHMVQSLDDAQMDEELQVIHALDDPTL